MRCRFLSGFRAARPDTAAKRHAKHGETEECRSWLWNRSKCANGERSGRTANRGNDPSERCRIGPDDQKRTGLAEINIVRIPGERKWRLGREVKSDASDRTDITIGSRGGLEARTLRQPGNGREHTRVEASEAVCLGDSDSRSKLGILKRIKASKGLEPIEIRITKWIRAGRSVDDLIIKIKQASSAIDDKRVQSAGRKWRR